MRYCICKGPEVGKNLVLISVIWPLGTLLALSEYSFSFLRCVFPRFLITNCIFPQAAVHCQWGTRVNL